MRWLALGLVLGLFGFLCVWVVLMDTPQRASARPLVRPQTCSQILTSGDILSPNIINFDDLADGSVIGTYHQGAYGVTFEDSKTTQVKVHADVEEAVSQPNKAENIPVAPNTSSSVPLRVTFDSPMSAVGMWIGNGDGSSTSATLTAYDKGGGEICSVSFTPVPTGLTQFLGLRDDAGNEIWSIALDYGKVIYYETIDDFYYSNVIPPTPCPVSWAGYPKSLDAGSPAVVTWDVAKKGYYSSQTYVVYDTVPHTQAGPYASYQAPSPNSGAGNFSTGIPTRAAGWLYVRPALTYRQTADAKPETCLGGEQIAIQVKPFTPPVPPKGSVAGKVTAGKVAPLKDVNVKVCLGSSCLGAASDKNGDYSIPNLAPGVYSLNATLDGYEPFVSRVSVTSGHKTVANIDMRLIPTPTPPPPSGTIRGRTLEQGSGVAVPAAVLDLRPAWWGNASTYFATTSSDASGNFSFNNVPVGEWLVFASQRDYSPWFHGYHVTASATATGDISLRRHYYASTPSPGAALDLSVAHVMVVQASQKWNNSLQLAAGRETAVRAFIDLGSSNSADLHASVGGILYSRDCLPETGLSSNAAMPLAVSNWASSNTQRTAVLQDPARTLNFNLPLSCTNPGTRHFTLRVPPTLVNPERSFDNNSRDFTVTFTERRPLIVHVVRISLRQFFLCHGFWYNSYPAPPPSAVAPAFENVSRIYPTRVYIVDGGTEDYCASPRFDNSYPGWWYINLGLSLRFIDFSIASAPGYYMGGGVPMAYGLVDGHECDGSTCWGGETPMILDHSWVSSGLTSDPITSAHEIGHARGLLHASNSHGESGGGSYTPWPYPHGAFSQFGPNETWGFSPYAIDASHPFGWVFAPVPATPDENTAYVHELMSYGAAPHWLSDINWNNLFHSFRTPGGAADAQPAPQAGLYTPQRYLLIGGMQRQDGTFEITAMRPLTDTTGTLAMQPQAATSTNITLSPLADPISYTLQLENVAGTVLANQQFKPVFKDNDKQASFLMYLPYPTDVAALTILTGTQVITTHLYSSQAPQVTITAPSASGVYTNSLTLTWEASDPDGDPLSYDIRYSPDGGASWQGVTAMLPSEAVTYTVNLRYLPGSENAFFKVIASDGLNTGSGITAAPVVVTRKAPKAVLTSLQGGEKFGFEDIIRLEGTLMDPETLPPYEDAAFVWTSNRDGVIGVGQNSTVYGLTPGRHTITLTVTDHDGMTGKASVKIQVGSNVFLPRIAR
jgi:hypothetical protein